MKNLTSITSKFWPVGRFFKKSEWFYWNPLLWNSDRRPRWYYSIYRTIYFKFKKDNFDYDFFN
jgi:hypothetical protein